ncbi:DUF2500 domain-containing protein [Paenibacillus guangzhouensis]|uniref:DUF2500 domain-containing protein n=1 Tax=Paenibacillus guangzhouensis TaxID=1473112 RepID=UPI001D12D17C|nr:DUF2500 domain-containing protein [Paenibacillus guangzhouensis]
MDPFSGPGFGVEPPMFQVVKTIVIIGFVVVIIAFIVKAVGAAGKWSSNNATDPVTRPCKVVAKRSKVWGGSGDFSANTDYFITFEFEDRTRLELKIRNEQYGVIVEGDDGEVTYQGTRFKHFERKL